MRRCFLYCGTFSLLALFPPKHVRRVVRMRTVNCDTGDLDCGLGVPKPVPCLSYRHRQHTIITTFYFRFTPPTPLSPPLIPLSEL